MLRQIAGADRRSTETLRPLPKRRLLLGAVPAQRLECAQETMCHAREAERVISNISAADSTVQPLLWKRTAVQQPTDSSEFMFDYSRQYCSTVCEDGATQAAFHFCRLFIHFVSLEKNGRPGKNL